MDKPKRKSKRTPKELELFAVAGTVFEDADNIPVLGEYAKAQAMGLAQPDQFSLYHIPMNVEIKSGSTPLPMIILEEIIRRSTHRVICNVCNCREGTKCKKYPYNEYGCIHIGASTAEHNDANVKHATAEETIAHLRKGIEAGLIPMVGHFEADLAIWDISMPFFTVCMCCTCCCNLFRIKKRMPKNPDNQIFHRLKGLQVVVDNDMCTGCGKCAAECFAGCITIEDGKSKTDQELCTGCGVCVRTCPVKAREIQVENVKEAVDELLKRLSDRVGGLPTIEAYSFGQKSK
jgi:Pyruvate/2-oxoacid:ferredoxin oxidoreductase delta subunit